MKQLLRGIFVLFVMTVHCSPPQTPVQVNFDVHTDSYFHQMLTLCMQVWAHLKDPATLTMSSGDEVVGKLFRLRWYLEQLISNKEIVYEDDKRYLLSIIDHLIAMNTELDYEGVSELCLIFGLLLQDIRAEVDAINSF